VVYSYGLIDTLVSGGGTISFNDPTGDSWLVDPSRSTGLEMRKVRTSIYNRAQTNGYYYGAFRLEGRHLLLGGTIRVESASTEAAVLAVREAMIAAAIAVLEPIAQGTTTGTLNFVGGSSLTVKCDVGLVPSGAWLKQFVLGLVSTD